MLLKIPFHIQEKNECGPVSLMMVLEFLGEKEDKESIKKAVESESSGNTWTMGLAKVAAELGFRTEFYSKKLGFNPENYNLEFYQTQTDGADSAEKKIERIHNDCRRLGVKIEERSLELDEVLSKINESCTAIILLDWSKINGNEGYIGHFVPITGFDEHNVFVHLQVPTRPIPNFTIERSVFDIARKAAGTDEDIVFIHRK